MFSHDGRASKRQRVAAPHKPPAQLSRLDALHSALQHALSYALAACAVAPSETGVIRNVLNHISVTTYAGFTRFDEDDLKRLCWIWEWDPASPPSSTDEDPNPFLAPTSPPLPKDWVRGSMGFIISPTSHYLKTTRRRVPVYGIGIQVETDINMTGSMAAVAKWTVDADKRRAEFRSKLESWAKHYSDVTPIPDIPLADLPQLVVHSAQPSSLTLALASASPKGAAILADIVPSGPSTPSKPGTPCEFPLVAKTHSSELSPSKSSTSLLRTPSSCLKRADPLAGLLTPKTPVRKRLDTGRSDPLPTTPLHQSGLDAQTAPSTPSTSRRQALYERVRLKSLTSTPAKAESAEVAGDKITREQIQKLGQEEVRRRCLLGRLGGVAECTWMLFSSGPSPTIPIPTTRKRKALPASDVITAVIKSSSVPMSTSEASESLKLLATLCPFFLKSLDINGEEWLEMPPTTPASDTTESYTIHDKRSPTKLSRKAPPPSPGSRVLPPSPGSKAALDSTKQLLTRSPRRVRREAGGIREVREIIRRELELYD